MARRTFRKRNNRKKRRTVRRRSSRRKIGSQRGGLNATQRYKQLQAKSKCCEALKKSQKATLDGDCGREFGAMTQQQCIDRQACIAKFAWSDPRTWNC